MYRFVLIFLATMAFSAQADGQDKPVKRKEKDKVEKTKEEKKDSDETFGDYVKKAGASIWGRLKVRFNLDQRGEEIKRKSHQIFGRSDGEKKNRKKAEPAERIEPSDSTQISDRKSSELILE